LVFITAPARLSLNVCISVREQNATTQVVYLACCAAGAAVAMTVSTHLAHVTVFTNLPFIRSLPGDVLIGVILQLINVLPSVRPSVQKKIFRFRCNLVRRQTSTGRVHPCDLHPIQGRGRGHGASEFPKIVLLWLYLLRHFGGELKSDSW